jgi:hypothetical protein
MVEGRGATWAGKNYRSREKVQREISETRKEFIRGKLMDVGVI